MGNMILGRGEDLLDRRRRTGKAGLLQDRKLLMEGGRLRERRRRMGVVRGGLRQDRRLRMMLGWGEGPRDRRQHMIRMGRDRMRNGTDRIQVWDV